MPPKRDSSLDPCPALSVGEQKLIIFSIVCTSTTSGGKNTIDWQKLASLSGYLPSSAQKMYGNARKKLKEFSDASNGARSAPPNGSESKADASAGSTPGPTAPASTENGNGNENDQGTPPKKARKARKTSTPRKRKAEKQEVEEDGKDDGPAAGPATTGTAATEPVATEPAATGPVVDEA